MVQQATIAAIATPPGKGGIAVIRISGKEALNVANRVFYSKSENKSIKNAAGYTAIYGTMVEDGILLDEGIALVFRGPHSYTGEDVVELSCHGGEAVSAMVLQACLKAGAAPAPPGEFTRRAVMNGKISLTQAEAVIDIISAESRQGAMMAKTAMNGILYKEIKEMKDRLLQVAGHLAAWTDYPEEGVEELTEDGFLQVVEEVSGTLSRWILDFDRGEIIRRGVPVAIVGSPNVGKSTLFNVLTGNENAIVTPVAGTTRDVVRSRVQLGGAILDLADTAGLHETDDVVEKEGIRRSREEMEKAGLVVAVFDASQPLDETQLDLARRCKGRPALAILNKNDLGQATKIDEIEKYFTRVLTVGAGQKNIGKIIEKNILEILDIAALDVDAAALANRRQLASAVEAKTALEDAAAAMRSGLTFDAANVCVEDALRALNELSGESASAQVIDEVFSKFCVGK